MWKVVAHPLQTNLFSGSDSICVLVIVFVYYVSVLTIIIQQSIHIIV